MVVPQRDFRESDEYKMNPILFHKLRERYYLDYSYGRRSFEEMCEAIESLNKKYHKWLIK